MSEVLLRVSICSGAQKIDFRFRFSRIHKVRPYILRHGFFTIKLLVVTLFYQNQLSKSRDHDPKQHTCNTSERQENPAPPPPQDLFMSEQAAKRAKMSETYQMLIDGQLCDGATSFGVTNPSTG